MTFQLHDAVFTLGIALAVGGAWCISWPVGLVATGVAIALGGIVVRAVALRPQVRTRRRKG